MVIAAENPFLSPRSPFPPAIFVQPKPFLNLAFIESGIQVREK